MSFINGNTINPVDGTYIGYTNQRYPFASISGNNYNSGSSNFAYDNYEIPKGVWLISASFVLNNNINVNNLLNNITTAIALPNNVTGKNFNGLTFNSGSGLNSFTASVCEPYYSDGTKSCGIYFYVDTTDSNDYVFPGNTFASMTYVKIA